MILSLKFEWVTCLNSRTKFLYIYAPTLFTNFSVIIAILLIKSEHHLKVRASAHVSFSTLTSKSVNNSNKSAVKDHCVLSGHVCSFDDFVVLNYEWHKFIHLIKESLFVIKDKLLLNKQVKSF